MIPAHFDARKRLAIDDVTKLTAINFGAGDYSTDVARPLMDLPFKALTSVEAHQPTVMHIATLRMATKMHVIEPTDISTWDDPRDYDVAFLFDVIEHLYRIDAIKLLDWLDEHIKKKVVMFVPLEPEGFHRQSPDDTNPYQEHLSHWTEQDFISRGYKTEVINDCHSEPDGRGGFFHFGAVWAVKNQ